MSALERLLSEPVEVLLLFRGAEVAATKPVTVTRGDWRFSNGMASAAARFTFTANGVFDAVVLVVDGERGAPHEFAEPYKVPAGAVFEDTVTVVLDSRKG